MLAEQEKALKANKEEKKTSHEGYQVDSNNYSNDSGNDGISVEEGGDASLSKSEVDIPTDYKSLLWSFLMLLFAIPALIGSWCWPVLLFSLFSSTASLAAREIGHVVALLVMAGMMTIQVIYISYVCIYRNYHKSTFHRFTPLALVIVAAVMVCLDPARHVMMDHGWWFLPFSGAEYRPNCNAMSFECLSATGWIITIGCTYVGFILLFVGTFWAIDFHKKMAQILRNFRTLYRAYRQNRKSGHQGINDEKQPLV